MIQAFPNQENFQTAFLYYLYYHYNSKATIDTFFLRDRATHRDTRRSKHLHRGGFHHEPDLRCEGQSRASSVHILVQEWSGGFSSLQCSIPSKNFPEMNSLCTSSEIKHWKMMQLSKEYILFWTSWIKKIWKIWKSFQWHFNIHWLLIELKSVWLREEIIFTVWKFDVWKLIALQCAWCAPSNLVTGSCFYKPIIAIWRRRGVEGHLALFK